MHRHFFKKNSHKILNIFKLIVITETILFILHVVNGIQIKILLLHVFKRKDW